MGFVFQIDVRRIVAANSPVDVERGSRRLLPWQVSLKSPLPPLAGTGPDAATTLTVTNDTNEDVAKTTPKLFDGKPLTRLSLFAKPNEGITLPDETKSDRPSLRGALGNVHPVRDVVKAVSGAVKKALGKEDDAGTTGGNAPES